MTLALSGIATVREVEAWDSRLARHNNLNGVTFTELTSPSFPTNSRLASLFWNVRFGAGVTVYRWPRSSVFLRLLLLDTLHRSILFFSTQKNDLREKFARSKSNIVTGHCRTPAAEYLELELAARQKLLPFWLQVRSSLPFSLFCCGCADRQEATDAIGSCGRLADDL